MAIELSERELAKIVQRRAGYISENIHSAKDLEGWKIMYTLVNELDAATSELLDQVICMRDMAKLSEDAFGTPPPKEE